MFGDLGASGDPWFRVGRLCATTTVVVSLLSVFGMVLSAVEGRGNAITQYLILNADSNLSGVTDGQIWRLLTWPIVNAPNILTVILIAVFWMLGSRIEALMGRVRFTFFLFTLVLVPAVIMSLFELTPVNGSAEGLWYLQMSLLVAFVTHYSGARFWPGLPGSVLVGILVGLAILSAIAARSLFQLVIIVVTVCLAPLLMRGLGYAEDQRWLPKLQLTARPQSSGYRHRPKKQTRAQRKAQQRRRQERQQRQQPHLSAVPPPLDSPQARIDALLDKINVHGVEGLTETERQTLEQLSKGLRDKQDDG